MKVLAAPDGIALVFALKALLAGPRLDQRPIHGEVLIGHQLHRLSFDLFEERLGHFLIQQPIPILAVHGRVPHPVIDLQAYEPAEQQVVIELLHEQVLAADRVEHL